MALLFHPWSFRAIVFRTADDITGDWSAEKIIMHETGEALYAPYFHPWFNEGKDLWFVISHASPTWNMFLMKGTLTDDSDGFNMIKEPGFEDFPDDPIQYRTLWEFDGASASDDSHTGRVSCRLDNDEGWRDAALQTVPVRRNTDYVLKAWAKSSNEFVTGAYLGVRCPDGTVMDTNPVITNMHWTEITYEFNSGDNTSVDVFFGVWGWPGLYVLVDDFAMYPLQ